MPPPSLDPRGPPPCNLLPGIRDHQTIDQTVQKNLRQLRADCDRVLARLSEVEATDAANKESNATRTLQVGDAVTQ